MSDYSKLIERLEDHARNVGGDESFDRLYGSEACAAADAITALSARVRVLEEALRQIADNRCLPLGNLSDPDITENAARTLYDAWNTGIKTARAALAGTAPPAPVDRAAIEAEVVERCARVADAKAEDLEQHLRSFDARTARAIAAAIRRLAKPQEGG